MTKDQQDNAIRAVDLASDLVYLKRIWREVGWVEDAEEEAALDDFFKGGNTRVATIEGVPECSVHITQGSMRLQSQALPLCAVTAVTTSRIARGQAFAQRLTAEQLAHGRAQGAVVSALGMFDQGFYDKLGFGTGAYDHEVSFDPGQLTTPFATRPPVRLTTAEADEMYRAMQTRLVGNGGVTLHSTDTFRAELQFVHNGFGLGFRDAQATLTHFLWFDAENVERGPYRVAMIAYQNTQQLMELMGLIRSLGDQIYSVTMMEPRELQLQQVLNRPLRVSHVTKGGRYPQIVQSTAWWQVRILDVCGCLQTLSGRLPDGVDNFRFSMEVVDPIHKIFERFGLADGWQGESGCYQVHVENGRPLEVHRLEAHVDEPHLRCSVNALSRMVWSVMPASSLALTDELGADPETLAVCDELFAGARPVTGLDF